MKVKLIIPPTTEPLLLLDALEHLRIDSDIDTEDTFVEQAISTCRGFVESITNRKLVTQTWELYLDGFPSKNYINLPFGNLQSVESVVIKNCLGEETELAATTQYLVDSSSDPGRIVLPYSVSWPTFTPYPFNAVTIRFTCGYGAYMDVPQEYKAAIKLLIGDLYENREAQVILKANQEIQENETVMNLLRNFRLWVQN